MSPTIEDCRNANSGGTVWVLPFHTKHPQCMKKEVKRNPDRPFEDMEGNWIGLGYRGTKPNPKKRGDYSEGGSSGSRTFSPKGIETGELEKLEKKCRDGDEEACAKLCKLEKDNEDFLEHLMAIADYDEYPPKLKEPKE